MPETMFAGSFINSGTPIPATIALELSGEHEWIIGVMDGTFLKMVHLRVTGENTFDWISTKYTHSYDATCLTSFSESCFTGTTVSESFYQVQLSAKKQSK